MNDFDAIYNALAERMMIDLRQDPSVGLQKDAKNGVIRGIVRIEGGEKMWYGFTIDWERVKADGPEAVAFDLIEDLKVARSQHGPQRE